MYLDAAVEASEQLIISRYSVAPELLFPTVIFLWLNVFFCKSVYESGEVFEYKTCLSLPSILTLRTSVEMIIIYGRLHVGVAGIDPALARDKPTVLNRRCNEGHASSNLDVLWRGKVTWYLMPDANCHPVITELAFTISKDLSIGLLLVTCICVSQVLLLLIDWERREWIALSYVLQRSIGMIFRVWLYWG